MVAINVSYLFMLKKTLKPGLMKSGDSLTLDQGPQGFGEEARPRNIGSSMFESCKWMEDAE